MSFKLHNPKSHAPAVYIPCWLIQVPIKLLSHGAKMTYGRLSQWASANGTVYRSVPQLAQELGCSERSVEEYLKELKNVTLIGTFHPQAGGVNHYEFYDHIWMHSPIKEQLVYKQDKYDPPHDSVVPPTRSCATPPHDRVDINIKEIKRNKKNPSVDSSESTGVDMCTLFALFYSLYPNKQKPKEARKAFEKLKPTKEFTDMLCEDVKRRIENNWKGRDKSKIPHPSTYLNQREWEGEIFKCGSSSTTQWSAESVWSA